MAQSGTIVVQTMPCNILYFSAIQPKIIHLFMQSAEVGKVQLMNLKNVD